MLINEVESKIGLSKKSIRYYEENGLLNPKRNKYNDYRDYDDNDIIILRKIKFLRELGITINELKELTNNTLSLKECLKKHLSSIDVEQEKYEKVKSICNEILSSNENYEDIKINNYYQPINILNKEGFTMRETKTPKITKVTGALISTLVFITPLAAIIIAFIVSSVNSSIDFPFIVSIIVILIPSIIIICLIVNLISRLKEIYGGEEDEASKY